MRKILAIIGKDLLILMRDKTAFFLLLVMPLVLILVLGSVFGSMWSSGPGRVPVVVVDLDGGELARVFREEVLGSPEIKASLEVSYENDRVAAGELVKEGKAAGCIIIPEGFSEKVFQGKEAELEVILDSGRPVGSAMVSGIAQAFTQEVSEVQVTSEEALRALAERGALTASGASAVVGRVSSALRATVEKPLIGVATSLAKSRSVKEMVVGAMDYYAIGMLLMYTVFTAMAGAASILDEKSQRTWTRMAETPTPASSLIVGKLGYMIISSLIQVSLVAGASKLLFGVNWGRSALLFYLVAFAVVVAVDGIVLTIAVLVSSSESLASVVVPLNFILAFLGGSMWPVYLMPDWLNAVSRITPLRWGLSAFIALNRGATLADLALPLEILFTTGVVFMVTGTFGIRKKGWA
ncbi:MAG: ABC transporter permease [Candidatus Fermentithermobacillus carboniphilus]|uniref:ABC transporter permease n=1 Tax=Candidatus Fermentithermobacillus carboniphilus TaxID=3085328 RepID=A0AAT9LDN5_9FIRM|nr:MAG: ABC transporter permease [Candidatus Fermentithermobacillus carboniphilus]